MNVKPYIDFGDHEGWKVYVHHEVPPQEQGYVLTMGRTEMFRRFYEAGGHTFPDVFTGELERIERFNDPERTEVLVSLNGCIVASLTGVLFADARPTLAQLDAAEVEFDGEQIEDLLNELSARNPYSVLCTSFRQAFGDGVNAWEWNRYLGRKLGSDAEDEIRLKKSMMEMGAPLRYFRDQSLQLPRRFRDRVWFLHYLGEPEGSVQTRPILSSLATEIEACTCA